MKKITLLAMSLMMALVVTAQEAGKDITSQFENTDFETQNVDGWTCTGPSNADGRGAHAQGTAADNGYQGTWFMEAWNGGGTNFSAFDWSQTVNVPNGYYVVKALAHAIQQQDGSAPTGVFVYAEDQKTPVTTTTAAEYTVFAKVTDGTLTIGYCGTTTNVNWAGCDDFRVIQCFGDTEEAAKTSWLLCELQELVTQIEDEEILEEYMSQALKDEIQESIDAVESVSTYAEANALYEKMTQQKKDAEECIAAYEKLSEAIDKYYEFADSEGADDLYDVLDEADEKYNEGTLTAAEALAEIGNLNDAVFEYNLSITDGNTGFDVTELFVKDPSVRTKEQIAAWTVNVTNNKNDMPAWGHDCIEFWSCDFTISQTLENIPNGKYKIRVQGFYRVGSNDSGSGYAKGTDVITAKLFANDEEQPFTSLYKYTAAEMGVTPNLMNGYLNGLESASIAFSTVNPATGRNYYDENELEVIVMDNKLTFGVRNVSTVSDRWCAFRDFQLSYYGNFPSVNLYGKRETVRKYLTDNLTSVPNAVAQEVSRYRNSILPYTIEGAYEESEVNAVILQFDSVWAEALKAIELFAELKAIAGRIEDELLPLDYPGKADLNATLQSMQPYFEETSTVNTYASMQTLKAEVEAAIIKYYKSQVATPDIAADYTFLIPNPNFEVKGDWTWSMNAGGTDLWNGGCCPTEEGGAKRQGVNLWGWGITMVDVHQQLKDLPDGLYKVSAELMTQTNYATDQHVYATAANKVVSENLSVEGWDTYEWTELATTDYAVVVGGRLTIGAEASQGGTNSEGWFQAANFKLYYYGPASAEQIQAAWESTKERADEALDILIPNEKKGLASVMDEANPLAAEGKYAEACALVAPMIADLDSTIKATQAFYGGYYARLDTLRLREGYEECDSTFLFSDAVVAMADEILSSDTATCKLFDDLNAKLQAYSSYAASLRDAEYAINDTYPEEYETFVADSVIRPQVDSLLCELHSVEFCNQLRDQLDKAVNILKGTGNFTKEINEGDVTYLIANPTVDVVEGEELAGWTVVNNNAVNCGTNKSEHYSGNATNTYLDAWNGTAGAMNSTFNQEIIGIPDGTYRLTVAARVDGENAYIFAATTQSGIANDTTKWEMIKNYAAWRGEIWESDSLLWEADGRPEIDLEENYPYFMARPDTSTAYGLGYGWSWHVIENIEVTNHYLNIGITADNTLTGELAFTGTWMGADDWKLELIKINEVQSDFSEFNPFEGFDTEIVPDEIEQIELEPVPVPQGIYDLFGRRIETITAPGLYIVNGKKVLVK